MKRLPALVLVLGVTLALSASARAGPGGTPEKADTALPAPAAEMTAPPADGPMCRPARPACSPGGTGLPVQLAAEEAEGEEGEEGAEDYDACIEQCDTVRVKCKRECTWKHCVQLCDSKYYECRDTCAETHGD